MRRSRLRLPQPWPTSNVGKPHRDRAHACTSSTCACSLRDSSQSFIFAQFMRLVPFNVTRTADLPAGTRSTSCARARLIWAMGHGCFHRLLPFLLIHLDLQSGGAQIATRVFQCSVELPRRERDGDGRGAVRRVEAPVSAVWRPSYSPAGTLGQRHPPGDRLLSVTGHDSPFLVEFDHCSDDVQSFAFVRFPLHTRPAGARAARRACAPLLAAYGRGVDARVSRAGWRLHGP